jgi:hypothetical protein
MFILQDRWFVEMPAVRPVRAAALHLHTLQPQAQKSFPRAIFSSCVNAKIKLVVFHRACRNATIGYAGGGLRVVASALAVYAYLARNGMWALCENSRVRTLVQKRFGNFLPN